MLKFIKSVFEKWQKTNLMFRILLGIIIGSVCAIREHDIRRMIAFSSVAQIGYIYAGLGLGVHVGYAAAIFHMVMHAFAKSALFMSASSLADASGNSKVFRDLRGAGFRSPIAGVAFTIGALSMVGFPFLGGFVAGYGNAEEAAAAVKLLGFESTIQFRGYLNQLLGEVPIPEDLLKTAAGNLLSDPGKLKNYPFSITEAELLNMAN